MDFKKGWQSKVDEEGRLVLPPEVVSRFGLKPGTQVLVDEGRKEYFEKFKNRDKDPKLFT